MIGRFIDGITQCQQACREDRKYEVAAGDSRAKDILLLDKPSYLMDEDVRPPISVASSYTDHL